jgi:hypothetical protein
MTTKKKPQEPKFIAEVLVRTWVQVPLKAENFEDAFNEAGALTISDAATINDGCSEIDGNITLITVRREDVLDKLDN